MSASMSCQILKGTLVAIGCLRDGGGAISLLYGLEPNAPGGGAVASWCIMIGSVIGIVTRSAVKADQSGKSTAEGKTGASIVAAVEAVKEGGRCILT
eukprot:15356127-Ditylum_brightwellii.AAC.2